MVPSGEDLLHLEEETTPGESSYPLKTLVFCTSYAETPLAWEQRHRLWIRSLEESALRFDQLLIVDDASPVLPDLGRSRDIQRG